MFTQDLRDRLEMGEQSNMTNIQLSIFNSILALQNEVLGLMILFF